MSYMNMCLRGVRSPTLARGNFLIDCDRGVRKPALIIYPGCYFFKKLRNVRSPTLNR